MTNKDIVYDKIVEIDEVIDSPRQVNEYLSEYIKVDETTCLVWDIIACVRMDLNSNREDHLVYVLGKKYKRIDHTNE